MKLQHQIALVTGGSRGLGAAIAMALAEAGTDIAINYRHSKSKADEVKAAIEKLGRRAITVEADVSDAAQVDAMAQAVEATLGAPTILVNNAGIAKAQKIEEITEADWDEILRVNLKSVFLVTQRLLPAMRRAHFGRIINLTSVAAQLGGVVGPHYAASKAGIIGITHSYAALLVKEGITANAISPALIATDMVTQNLNAKPDRIPVGRFGEPSEVADVAVMLAANGYITGQTINVNGGWYMSS
ncbi:MAG TPA: 3-oxoacyl-ACP reductase family protein [Candidatus Sulfopaludibacter sp.]|nr:3-oxoacyl-ACP reductase family protein [Candidatus Sulfopaludibacter sp.]